MDNNLDKVSFLLNQNIDKTDMETTQSRYEHGNTHLIKDLKDTIDVQRKIIAEQAVKVKELQKKLKKHNWNM